MKEIPDIKIQRSVIDGEGNLEQKITTPKGIKESIWLIYTECPIDIFEL